MLQKEIVNEEDYIDDDFVIDADFNEDDFENSIGAHSKYIDVHYQDGTFKTIRKSPLLWIKSESKEKLSADRLKRVQEAKGDPPKRRKIDKVSPTSSGSLVNGIHLIRSNEIEIGDWCFFKRSSFQFEQLSEQNILDNVLIGCIVSFKYNLMTNENSHQESHGPKAKKTNYSVGFASVSNNNVEALSSWYVSDANGKFQPVQEKIHFFIGVNNYIATFKNISLNLNTIEIDSKKCLSFASTKIPQIKSSLYRIFLENRATK